MAFLCRTSCVPALRLRSMSWGLIYVYWFWSIWYRLLFIYVSGWWTCDTQGYFFCIFMVCENLTRVLCDWPSITETLWPALYFLKSIHLGGKSLISRCGRQPSLSERRCRNMSRNNNTGILFTCCTEPTAASRLSQVLEAMPQSVPLTLRQPRRGQCHPRSHKSSLRIYFCVQSKGCTHIPDQTMWKGHERNICGLQQ